MQGIMWPTVQEQILVKKGLYVRNRNAERVETGDLLDLLQDETPIKAEVHMRRLVSAQHPQY